MSVEILSIPILPLGMVNAFALLAPRHTVLVDTGVEGSLPKVRAALASAGRAMADVDLVVLTDDAFVGVGAHTAATEDVCGRWGPEQHLGERSGR